MEWSLLERQLINVRHQGQHGSNLYVPVDNNNSSISNSNSNKSNNKYESESAVVRPPKHAVENDYMEAEFEDTKHKVYIYDLDKELAESESDEDRPIFIPDIEKHLHKIPKHILIGDDAKALANMQMVLYTVPTSLTVPKEQDSVRRAVIESRQRARERQAIGKVVPTSNGILEDNDNGNVELSHGPTAPAVGEDQDAMEID
jgi:hypothetical protein